MATQAQSILAQIKVLAAATLGGSWTELRYTYDVAKNDERAAKQAYGARPLEASSAASVTGFYTLNHRFELILVKTTARDKDTEINTVLADLYDKHDEIYQSFEATKLNLSGTVLLVSEPSLSEPEILDEKIVLRQQFTVKYRSSVP